MIRLKCRSLRGRLLLFFSMIILMAGLGQIVYVLSNYQMQMQQSTTASYAAISRADILFGQTVGRLSSACSTIAGDPNVQSYLRMQDDPSPDNLQGRKILSNVILNNFDAITKSNEAIQDIALADRGGQIMSCTGLFTYSLLTLIQADYNPADATRRLEVIEEPQDGVAVRRGIAYILPVYLTTESFAERNRLLGNCIVWCRPNMFSDIFGGADVTENSLVSLTNSENLPVAQKSPGNGALPPEAVQSLMEKYQAAGGPGKIRLLVQDRNAYYVLAHTDRSTGWHSIVMTPRRDIYADTFHLLLFGFCLAGVTMLVTLALGSMMIRSVTMPLEQIVGTLRRIGRGERRLRIHIPANGEFGAIARALNTMLDHLNAEAHSVFNMQSSLYEAELTHQDSELRVLQSQINPHFLYNTFECIRSIALLKKIPEIVTLSTSIANVFRYSAKREVLTTVKEELDCIRDYDRIISIRYADRLKLSMDVDPEICGCRVLKMFLQPLVESIVNQSLKETGNVVKVRIRGVKKGEELLFTVESSESVGLSSEAINRALSENPDGSPGNRLIVLQNIHRRLKLYYGGRCGLHIAGEPGEGIRANVRMRL